MKLTSKYFSRHRPTIKFNLLSPTKRIHTSLEIYRHQPEGHINPLISATNMNKIPII